MVCFQKVILGLQKVFGGSSLAGEAAEETKGAQKKDKGHCVNGPKGTYNNDPSAGSPTETLLRLLLPLNDRV
jgi:hypothetical protein